MKLKSKRMKRRSIGGKHGTSKGIGGHHHTTAKHSDVLKKHQTAAHKRRAKREKKAHG